MKAYKSTPPKYAHYFSFVVFWFKLMLVHFTHFIYVSGFTDSGVIKGHPSVYEVTPKNMGKYTRRILDNHSVATSKQNTNKIVSIFLAVGGWIASRIMSITSVLETLITGEWITVINDPVSLATWQMEPRMALQTFHPVFSKLRVVIVPIINTTKATRILVRASVHVHVLKNNQC